MTLNIPKVKMGDAQVPEIGFGCMGMSYSYGGFDDEESKRVLNKVVDLVPGIYLDTADLYGNATDKYPTGHHVNERLIGDTLKSRRDDFFIATKFGFTREKGGKITGVSNKPEHIRKQFENSLKALQMKNVDLLYAHRIDPEVPIETTVKTMAEYVKSGQVKMLGLSECSVKTLRKAHAEHPIAALQLEYSLFFTDVETNGIFEACRELGIVFVAYSPLGRGFLTGSIRSRDDLPKDDGRLANFPRFSEENFHKNLELVDKIKAIADKKGCTPSQLAIAWTIARGKKLGVKVLPIPGTKKEKYALENLGAGEVKVTDEDLDEIQELLNSMEVAGGRYAPAMVKLIDH